LTPCRILSGTVNSLNGALLWILVGALVATTAAADDGLSAAETRGKRIYTSGETESGRVIRTEVEVSGPVTSASTLPCIQCHGAGGEGIGVIAPGIRWEELSDPEGHEHPQRRHGRFEEASVARAIREGFDAAGNKLEPTMPRYTMTDADMADLVAYLKRIGTELDPGLTATTIRVGTVLPTQGSLAAVGEAIRKLLEAQFAEVNAGGGIHGRNLELVVGEYGVEDTPAFWAASDLVSKDRPFALIASFLPGYEAELSQLVKDEGLPLIGPYTLVTGDGGAEFEFFTQPSIVEQTKALIQSLPAELPLNKVVVVYPTYKSFELLSRAVSNEEDDTSGPRLAPYDVNGMDAERLVGSLRSTGAEAIVFLGSPASFRAVALEADNVGWLPLLLAPARFAEPVVFDLPMAFDGRVFLAYPALPDDYTEKGIIDFEILHQRYGLEFSESLAQVAAFTAARVLVEGLESAGPGLSRESLIDALEQLREFQPGLTPKVSFDQQRRVGVPGAYVLRPDLSRGWLDAEKRWVDLEQRSSRSN